MLNAAITSEDGTTRTATALNDVVLQRKETGRMVDFDTRIDGRDQRLYIAEGSVAAGNPAPSQFNQTIFIIDREGNQIVREPN